ncbi:hypothetical protein J2X31_003602 [Flavobacterium arsenatis]|uniref:Uncharacterized protein n=1 Tax=Flavobacterium arsenatis TaxID=1484332 RepID=A0ABU1TUL0_9FLAO|nr:hypothetical protein [Flavobacterium arsenatis]MDR6969569.1 hypothetical protein [Flavobacterium arsenatis]
MEIILILLLLIILVSVFTLYKIILWISKKKTRVNWTLSLLGILILAKIINFIFFTKMELIQSKAYKNMYLIKNPINNRDSIHSFIKQICLERMNKEFIGNEEKYKYHSKDGSNVWVGYHYFNFYNYTDNFLGSNTAHFIENKEDDGGPTSMYFLSTIEDEKIATFSIEFCENDTVNYYAKIIYHRGYEIDTIFSKCTEQPKKIIPINEPFIHSTEGIGTDYYPIEKKQKNK